MLTKPVHYKVCISFLDDEHLTLLEGLERCRLKVCETDYPAAQVEIEALYKLLEAHFTHEESFLRDNSYPDYKYHVEEHTEIMAKVQDILKDILVTNKLTIILYLLSTLESAITGHIGHSDIRYAEHFKTVDSNTLIVRDTY